MQGRPAHPHIAVSLYSHIFLWVFDLYFLARACMALWHRQWIYGITLLIASQYFAIIGARLTRQARFQKLQESVSGKSRRGEMHHHEALALGNAMVSAGCLFSLITVATCLHQKSTWIAALGRGILMWIVSTVGVGMILGLIMLLARPRAGKRDQT